MLTIETPRLKLRQFDEADAQALHQILNMPDVLKYFPNSNPPSLENVGKFIQQQLKHWDEKKYGWWAVQLHENSDIIGWSGLQYLPDTDEVEIGYLLSPTYWGKGLATEGAKEGIQFGFEQLTLDTIVGIVHRQNVASQRVLEKLGLSGADEAIYFNMEVFRYSINLKTFSTNRN